jgi:hypothetical protein
MNAPQGRRANAPTKMAKTVALQTPSPNGAILESSRETWFAILRETADDLRRLSRASRDAIERVGTAPILRVCAEIFGQADKRG